jgi:hypothetical protein
MLTRTRIGNWKKSGDCQLTARLYHTYPPDTMAGMSSKGTRKKNTASGMSCGAIGRKTKEMRERKSSPG